MDMTEEIGSHLRRARENAGLGLREVARQLEVGHTKLHHWEKTGKITEPEAIVRLAAIYHVSVEEILGQAKVRPDIAPNSKLARLFVEISKLPRKRQQRIVDVVEDMLTAQLSRKSA
jgi:transcriptional regulator with XRE-family HTH domain